MGKIDLDRLRELTEDPKGLSVTQICQEVGCSRDTFYRKRKIAQQHGWQAASPIRNRRTHYRADSAFQKKILDLAIDNPELGYRRIKKLLPANVTFDLIKETLRKYDLTTVPDRLVARYVLKNANASLIPNKKWRRRHKVNRIITPDHLTPKDLAKILRNVVRSARHRVPIIYPTCILLLSFRILKDLIPGKDALEVVWLDIFSNYTKVQLHELREDAIEKQYDYVLTQTITQDIFSHSNSCRLLFIEDYSNLFPHALTKYQILHNLIYKIKYPMLQKCLYQIRKNALAIVQPLGDPNSDWIITAARRSSGTSISEINQKIQTTVIQYNNSNYNGKFCFGRTPKQTFDQGACFVRQENLLLRDKDSYAWDTIFGRLNQSRHHSEDCNCEACLFTRDFLKGDFHKPRKSMARWREVPFEKQNKYTL